MAVMTTRFVSAAELMARVLGFPGYAFAVIPHPISSASDDGLRAMAAVAIEQARKLLTGG
jgi:cytosine/adenosine deaminase-related metal-dependent hydrolase